MGKDFEIPSTGNKYVDTAIGTLVAGIIIFVGIVVMSQLCPIGFEQVKDNPQAMDAMTKLCSIFFQFAPRIP